VGDYYGAVDQKITSENITKVLYPTTNLSKANSCGWNNSISSFLLSPGYVETLQTVRR